MNVNKVIIVGNLTRDPEIRTLPSGQVVASFGLATNRFWTDKNTGEKKKEVEFHNVVAFGRLAEIIQEFLFKGSMVYIEGRLRTSSWQDKKTQEKRSRTEIIAERMQLGPRRQPGAAGPEEPAVVEEQAAEEPAAEAESEGEINPEEIPF